MRKIILDLAVTLDGFIEGPKGETDWCIMEDDMDFEGFLASIDTILYGRVSYDLWGNFQPEGDVNEAEKAIWKAVHSKKKYVFTNRPQEDGKDEFVGSNIAEKVEQIKQQPGKDIWLYGGASLIKSFIELDLIDVYRISLHPTVLGAGKPLFENLKQRINLKLLDLRRFKSGVVQLVYEPVK
jgi:dihydrofolate reductase